MNYYHHICVNTIVKEKKIKKTPYLKHCDPIFRSLRGATSRETYLKKGRGAKFLFSYLLYSILIFDWL